MARVVAYRSNSTLFYLQGHNFSREAIAVRRERLSAYVASIDGFDAELANRAAVPSVFEAHHVPFSDRWLKRIRSMLNAPPAEVR